MADNYDDKKAADYYADPEHRAVSGKEPRRRAAQGLSTHVPIRFRPKTIDAIRRLAASDGTTVSGWIRHACEREIERRLPPFTEVSHQGMTSGFEPDTETRTSDTTDFDDTFARSA